MESLHRVQEQGNPLVPQRCPQVSSQRLRYVLPGEFVLLVGQHLLDLLWLGRLYLFSFDELIVNNNLIITATHWH